MCTTPPVVSKRNHKDGITGQSVTVTMVSIDMKSHRQVVYDVAMEWSFQYVSPELIRDSRSFVGVDSFYL